MTYPNAEQVPPSVTIIRMFSRGLFYHSNKYYSANKISISDFMLSTEMSQILYIFLIEVAIALLSFTYLRRENLNQKSLVFMR